jgi:cobalt-zinc-cadmium efflux system membrane fusion protein
MSALIPDWKLFLTAARSLGPKSAKLVVVVTGGLFLAGCQKTETAATTEAPGPKVEGTNVIFPTNSPQRNALSIEAAQPHKAPMTRMTGRLLWDEDVTVRVFTPFGGRVQKVLIDLGAKVTAGTTLARIESPDIGQAQADARKAGGDLQLAQRSLTRVKELFEHGASARKDMESAEADLTRAMSENERAVARIKLYGGNEAIVDQVFPLKSPISGVVVERNISAGQELRPDQMLGNDPRIFSPQFVITDPTKLWLQLDVTESDLGELKAGCALRVSTKAFPGKEFDGRLELIGDSIDPNTRTVKVRAVVSNPDKLLKAEMYVNAELAQEIGDNGDPGVDVAAKAVFMKDNVYYLFVEEAPGRFERRAVQPGPEHDGRILVKGLKVGQQVVIDGSLLLQALLD